MKPHNLRNRFRRNRMRKFLELVAPLRGKGTVRIVDLGGTAHYWRALPALYGADDVEITILNLGAAEARDANLTIRAGDACNVDFPDMAFDIVHSNSVIEHVGRWPEMQRMAAEVRRLAPAHFVQTPNFWFPLEPHYRLPLVQFLPERARAFAIEKLDRFPSGEDNDGLTEVRKTVLIGPRQMRALFPDSEIWRERFAGLAKSLVAIRRATG